MASPYSDHADGIEELQNELGAACPVFTWNSVTYKILPGSARFAKPNEPGGFALENDLSFVCLADQFSMTALQVKEAILNTFITYLGAEFRVSRANLHAGGLQLRIEAVSAANL